jgi:hypothetical protein
MFLKNHLYLLYLKYLLNHSFPHYHLNLRFRSLQKNLNYLMYP